MFFKLFVFYKTAECETEVADFELQLIQAERDNGFDSFNSSSDSRCRAVTFKDDLEVYGMNSSCNSNRTPSSSPGTPKAELRARCNYLATELDDLRQFSTLEKQSYLDTCNGNNENSSLVSALSYCLYIVFNLTLEFNGISI